MAIVGLALATYKQLLISKRLGVSQTGIDVMSGRWTMHEFGMREDEATARMATVLPNYSPLGMWMVLFPLWVYSRIAGGNSIYPRQVAPGQEDIRDLVTARTRYFDSIIERRMPEVEQFVVMGAGYDTRCYGGLRAGPQRFFEADEEVTQQVKTAALYQHASALARAGDIEAAKVAHEAAGRLLAVPEPANAVVDLNQRRKP